MRRIETVDEVRRLRRSLTGSLGLVPTMGFLHRGHLDLVRQARAAHDLVAVSIFVNPTQFGPREDFARYPRDLERDLALLAHEQVDLVWTPPVEEVYPPGYSSYVVVEGLTDRLEGAARPGHFRGVATVVCKLFTVIEPDQAYFGQKDAQQVLVIRRMTRDLNLPVELVVCPTIREPDGLALSSRNIFLDPAERRAAPAIYQGLSAAAAQYGAGERQAEILRALVRSAIESAGLFQIEYISVADPETLIELDVVSGRALISLAARLGTTRLIDNIVLGPDGAIDSVL